MQLREHEAGLSAEVSRGHASCGPVRLDLVLGQWGVTDTLIDRSDLTELCFKSSLCCCMEKGLKGQIGDRKSRQKARESGVLDWGWSCGDRAKWASKGLVRDECSHAY